MSNPFNHIYYTSLAYTLEILFVYCDRATEDHVPYDFYVAGGLIIVHDRTLKVNREKKVIFGTFAKVEIETVGLNSQSCL